MSFVSRSLLSLTPFVMFEEQGRCIYLRCLGNIIFIQDSALKLLFLVQQDYTVVVDFPKFNYCEVLNQPDRLDIQMKPLILFVKARFCIQGGPF